MEAIHEKNYRNLKKKTIWASILSLAVIIIGMFLMNIPYANEIMWLFSTPVVLWLGKDFESSFFIYKRWEFRGSGYNARNESAFDGY